MGAAEARERVELALRYLEEGRALVGRDPVQASERLYRAAEEAVKALALHYGLSGILEKVEKRGRWTAAELDEAVSRIAAKLGRWFSAAWDEAWALHVWGFYEAKLDSESVGEREPDIERIVVEAKKVVGGEAPSARSA